MESLVALSLAANAVQFLDFTIKVITQTRRIYRKKLQSRNFGEIEDLAQLALRIEEYAYPIEVENPVREVLKERALHKQSTGGSSVIKSMGLAKVVQSVKSLHASPEGTNVTLELYNAQEQLDPALVRRLHACDREILRLCCGCEEIAVKLRSTVKRLESTEFTVWDSFLEALRTVWGEEEIQTLQKRLESHRQQLTLLLIASVRDKVDILRAQQHRNHLDLYQLTENIRNRLDFLLSAQQQFKTDILEAIRKDHQSSNKLLEPAKSTSVLFHEGMSAHNLQNFHAGLLDWICFAELDTRHEKIAKAHAETFEWVFHPPPNNRWSNFATWLEEQNEHLYWITGKPAAGKSTLLKFIYHDPRTTEYLNNWANGTLLINCAFYFWNSGTVMQKSEEAMIRTFLHAALQQAPDLWSKVFPSKMEEFIMFADPWKQPLTYEEAKRAFQILIDSAGVDYKLFLFIDGLDEFHGNHDDLVSTIQSMLSPHVKICVSSRAWPSFEDGFRQRPSLRLEALTYNDIKHYVGSRFLSSSGFQELQQESPDEADKLIESITSKASGVFLWVQLVTDSLLKGLSDGERLEELQERLDTVPVDLEELFWKILTHVDEKHRMDMSQIFQIVRGSLKPLNLLELSYADDPDPELLAKVPFGMPDKEQTEARARRMRRRLKVRCKCLIEAEPEHDQPLQDASVTYLHRTVKDYLERDEIWTKFMDMTDGSFHLPIRLLHVCEANLKMNAAKYFEKNELTEFWEQVLYAIEYAICADSKNEQKLLHELDTLLSQAAETKLSNSMTILERNSVDVVPRKHWSACGKFGRYNSSFLHLAIQLQLTSFVEQFTSQHLSTQQNPSDKIHEATVMLLLATLHYDVFAKSSNLPSLRILRRDPSAKLIAMFLSQGADPNYKFDGALELHGKIRGSFSCWETHLREPNRGTEIWSQVATLFLNYGADPKQVLTNRQTFPEHIVKLAILKQKEKDRENMLLRVKGMGSMFRKRRTLVSIS